MVDTLFLSGPNIIQNELALFLVIPESGIDKQLGKIREFDSFLNKKFRFTQENEDDQDDGDDRCARLQRIKQEISSATYDGQSRIRMDSETRSGINNPGVSVEGPSKFFQKDSFDQTGLEMLSELK